MISNQNPHHLAEVGECIADFNQVGVELRLVDPHHVCLLHLFKGLGLWFIIVHDSSFRVRGFGHQGSRVRRKMNLFSGTTLSTFDLETFSQLEGGRGRPRRNVNRFRGGLVSKAQIPLYHSTLGPRVIEKKKRGRPRQRRPRAASTAARGCGCCRACMREIHQAEIYVRTEYRKYNLKWPKNDLRPL